MTILKLTYGNKATISLGNYENENPMYSVSIECDDQIESYDETYVRNHLDKIKTIIDGYIFKDFERVKQPKKFEVQRVTQIGDKIYPWVTSIISPEPPADIPYLDEHAYIGSLVHEATNNFIKGGCVANAYKLNKDTPKPQITANLKLNWEEYSMLKWMEKYADKYQVNFSRGEQFFKNDEFNYCGKMDTDGMFLDVYSFFDFKKTKTITPDLKEKYFMQLAAYAMCQEQPKPEGLVIISFHPTLPEPIVTKDIEKYFNMFLEKRKQYKDRFGI